MMKGYKRLISSEAAYEYRAVRELTRCARCGATLHQLYVSPPLITGVNTRQPIHLSHLPHYTARQGGEKRQDKGRKI